MADSALAVDVPVCDLFGLGGADVVDGKTVLEPLPRPGMVGVQDDPLPLHQDHPVQHRPPLSVLSGESVPDPRRFGKVRSPGLDPLRRVINPVALLWRQGDMVFAGRFAEQDGLEARRQLPGEAGQDSDRALATVHDLPIYTQSVLEANHEMLPNLHPHTLPQM